MRTPALFVRGALAATLLTLLSGVQAQAQSADPAEAYPTRSIRLIVPFAPGATTDFLARQLGESANRDWGQPVVVDNRAGAGGLIGTDLIAKAAPDGYTIGLLTGALATYPVLNAKLPFDSVKDFEFISMIASVPNVLVVTAAYPAKTFKDFVARAKADPGQGYASSGTGTNTHFTGEMLKLATGIDIQHVAYKGGAPAMADLIAGHVKIMIASLTTAVPQIRAGKIRALAVSSASRSDAVPDVPTFKELGYPDLVTAEWWALIGPKGMPKIAVSKWRDEARKLAGRADIKEKSPGIVMLSSTPEELADTVEREIGTWKDIAAKAKIALE
ncbi:Bug family tripartite tricarboxylate transporter substrate binding protein [Aquabacter spiritensis]|uniref:Tripartite-type tricarboxylate transporter receptor subunit TctC n=1 Tax=Aquabacter spiritensis TaxID=933073 RepID=A0A4R3LM80_9HYPH|nr:tripartite tricarboxylate transporter substrate binding protein [Aquabacter spiritensis]TCT01101.1 tripartite-type tricarboxylate transporter receptor subunit TctC [Aquabacter spiritensis]